MAQGNTLDLKILAANRSLASAFCLLDEIKKYAELSIHTAQVERKAIEEHLSSVTNDGQHPPEKQGAYTKLQQRLSELDRLETVAHEIIDQSDLVLNTDVAPSGLPKTWREKTMEGATIRPTDQGFIDEDTDGATRRYSRPQPQNDGVNLSETGKYFRETFGC